MPALFAHMPPEGCQAKESIIIIIIIIIIVIVIIIIVK